jgi:hypothetical protein
MLYQKNSGNPGFEIYVAAGKVWALLEKHFLLIYKFKLPMQIVSVHIQKKIPASHLPIM